MKSLLIASVGAAAALAASAPALAQDIGQLGPVTSYGSLGYSNLDGNHADLNGVEGRFGLRLGRYVGLEGDATGGFDGDHINVAGDPSSVRLRNEFAGYAVGYLPLAPNADLFARVGYGQSSFKVSNYALASTYNLNRDSLNYGVGGQYFFNGGPNGVRVDYTRYDYQAQNAGADNVWSLAYVRKF
jgi:opacity protein-like surface antigen